MTSPSDVSTRGGVSVPYDLNASLRAHDFVELPQGEVEDVLLLLKDPGLHEPLGLLQQRLLVNEVATDHAVLRILPVPGEGANPLDHPPGLFGLLLPIRQSLQSFQYFAFLLSCLL
jgi:hypothetical protein